jgi:hypothetical protein
MARVTLRLVTDPGTGERRIVVDYHLDADALAMEHEAAHRRLVERTAAPLGSAKLRRAPAGEPAAEAAPQSVDEELAAATSRTNEQ